MNYDVVEVIVDKLVRTFRLREWHEDMDIFVEDIAEALKLIGAERVFIQTDVELTVNGRIAPLPLGCQQVMSLIPTSQRYYEQGSYLVIDEPDGAKVILRCQMMPLDTRGWPLVPDNAAVREALMWFLVRNLTLRGEIKTVNYQIAEQEWQWRCKSARGDLNSLSMSLQATNKVYNDFVRLNPIKDQHARNYVGVGAPNTLHRDKYKDLPNSNF